MRPRPHEHVVPDPAPGQWSGGRHAVWRGRHVLCPDLQGHPGRNFGQGRLPLVGAWVCWALLTKYEVPFWMGMPLTLVFMFVFGIAIQIVILRPMIGEPVISVIMVTIGLSTVFQAALKWIFGVNPQPF